MVTDLFGYGSTVFAEFLAIALKDHSGIQRMFDYIALFKSKCFCFVVMRITS